MNVSNWFCCYQGKESKTLFSSGQKIKRFGELWVPGMHLSKGCRCEVVFCLWFCCYFLLAAGQVTDPTEVEALKVIKGKLIDINGNLSNWDRGDPCTSDWTGVMCSNTTVDNGYLHVLRLLLNGNELTGDLPEELGHLPVLDRIQIDENHITGSIPLSFANLNSTRHFHMNNNSLSGQIPPQLSQLGSLMHLLLDNNNLTGNLPSEFSEMPSLKILSLRNCNLQGPIPDFSRISHLTYLDLSNNKLTGTIPSYFSGLPRLQKLDMQNNQFASISGTTNLPANVTLLLEGNPVCLNNNSLVQFCGPEGDNNKNGGSIVVCPSQGCPPPYEYNVDCFCAAPLVVHYRLKSPGFSDFHAYVREFESFLTNGLTIHTNQLFIEHFAWEEGRLRMNLKVFPEYIGNGSFHMFSTSEVSRIGDLFRQWDIPDNELFGPYELLDFILLDLYRDGKLQKLLMIW
ncbi:hypothetical protein JHK84_041060 [Glycine max]|nr:hypothetical protein JHK84_041060 [Glycine max]